MSKIEKHAVHVISKGFVSTKVGAQTLSTPTWRTTPEAVIEGHMSIIREQQPNAVVTSETLT